ncbi:MAG TPA: GFA family protein [Dongiaceae bacterium]|nr:GFA family protein [Dongiaceae bacterium]
MLYKGSCHCGDVSFEVEGNLTAVVNCNCSICARKGALLWAVPRDKLRVQAEDRDIGRYTFNTHTIEHRFCRACGIAPYAEDSAAKTERSAYINVRCLDGIDLKGLPVIEFDGRSM